MQDKLLKNRDILISGIGKGLGKEMFHICKNGSNVYGLLDLKDLKYR